MAGPGAKPAQNVQPKLRLDKWLFAARFFKNRELAAEVIESGHLRLNGQRCKKPGHGVMEGDTLTFPQGRNVRVIRVLALSDRRGPAQEAQQLYHDLAPTADAPLE
ncbi:MAG: RNA-binding S4 domain-containing protein [Pseudomonadota bacterium]